MSAAPIIIILHPASTKAVTLDGEPLDNAAAAKALREAADHLDPQDAPTTSD